MTSTSEERVLRAYLLGELGEAEQLKTEERLLIDSDYVELLEAVEEELMDSYLRGRLSDAQREKCNVYFLSTPARRHRLRLAKAFRRYVDEHATNPIPTPEPPLLQGRRRWFEFFTPIAFSPGVAAAVKLVLMLIGGAALPLALVLVIRPGLFYSPFDKSLTAEGRSALRSALRYPQTDGRLTGFDWGPRPLTLGDQSNVKDLNSRDFAREQLIRAVHKNPGEESHHSLGQYYLATGDFSRAIEQLELGLQYNPMNAKIHSDLGLALVSKADEVATDDDTQLSDLLPKSLEHLNQAVDLDSNLLEALFNRALCRKKQKALLSQAEADCSEYLRRDGSSPWAGRARNYLEEVQLALKERNYDGQAEVQQFLVAYRTQDHQTASKLVTRNREWIKGRLIWWQLIEDLLRVSADRKAAEVDERLQALQYAGDVEWRSGTELRGKGDPFVRDLARFYRTSFGLYRDRIADAHRLIDEGNRLFDSPQSGEATEKYQGARKIFALIGDRPETMLADLLIKNLRLAKSKVGESSPSLFEDLAAESRKHGYRWLEAQCSFALGSIHDGDGDYSLAIEHTAYSLKISEELGDNYNIQRSLAQTADQYRKLGNYERASEFLNRCLAEVNKGWAGVRQMWRNCNQLTQMLMAQRYYRAAAEFGNEALWLAQAEGQPWMLSITYTNLGLMQARRGNYEEAIRLADLGYETAPSDQARTQYALLQLGNLYRQSGNWTKSIEYYDRVLASVDEDRVGLAYEANKGKLLCHVKLEDYTEADRGLQKTLRLLERYRNEIQDDIPHNIFFDVHQTVYDAAIGMEYARRPDNPEVFNYSEQSRARWLLAARTRAIEAEKPSLPLSLPAIQEGLPDQTELIEYAVLEDKVLVSRVSKAEFSVKEVKIDASGLTDKVLAFYRAVSRRPGSEAGSDEGTEQVIDRQARELYDLLIKPIGLSPGAEICIVPDKILNHLPFAALKSSDSGKYLIEDFHITISPSATLYVDCSKSAGERTVTEDEQLLIAGDPSFDRGKFPTLGDLRPTRSGIEEIAAFYRAPFLLVGKQARESEVTRRMEQADVIHLASHYVVHESSPMLSRLLLASEPGSPDQLHGSAGALEARETYSLKLRRRPVVLLSACKSGVEHYYNGEGMVGMSRAFVAAGAPLVVASLWDVDADAAGELMVNLHRLRRLESRSTVEALRQAQLKMLEPESESYRYPYYWAAFTAIGGHTGY